MSNLNKVAFELCWIVLGFDNGPKRPKNDTDFGLFTLKVCGGFTVRTMSILNSSWS